MFFQLLTAATVSVHFLFLAYVVVGGFLAWRRRWRWSILAHLAAVGWGVLAVRRGIECPLTDLESWSRRQAGQQGLERGFIDTYLTGVIYPAGYLTEIRLLIAAVVLASWVGFALKLRARRRVWQARRP